MSSTTKAIQVDARPEPLTLDPRSTAVIVVDMQNDFAAAGGMFDMIGGRLLYTASDWERLAQTATATLWGGRLHYSRSNVCSSV